MRTYYKSFFRHLRGDGSRRGVLAARVDAACWIGLFTFAIWSLS